MVPGESRAPRPNLAIAVLCLIAGLIVVPPVSHACSCPPWFLESDYEEADFVFAGVQIGAVPIVGEEGVYKVTVRVYAWWKDATGRYPRFFTVEADGSSCGWIQSWILGLGFPEEPSLIMTPSGSWVPDSEDPYVDACEGMWYDVALDELDWLPPPTVVPVEPTTWGGIKALYGREP
jgi:hypothetical protein